MLPLQVGLLDGCGSGTAYFSPCGEYRYLLTRELGCGGGTTCNFVMLNPSTADAQTDDNTLRRCISFARTWGHSRLVVTNLFAYRSTSPAVLRGLEDPSGPENDRVLAEQAAAADLVVCAWGTTGALRGRGAAVRSMLERAGARPHALRLTKDGHPEHPLYLPGGVLPAPWEAGR